ncbi:SPOR domain-containing protein [Bacillus solitudinis]|uniref:SPOR domain-containing protein n=1 Tax=Bacillus solitudinis TaxID=2014074 RepID=UPI000C24FDE1|nr:SPOR domain-containing protein [Bacillus solitudinis]
MIDTGVGETLYKVIAGSFKNRKNAKNQVSFLKEKNINAFIVHAPVSGENYYRIQAGAFKMRKNAEQQIAFLQKIGILDAFIIKETNARQEQDHGGNKTPSGDELKNIYFIKGINHLTSKQLNDFVKRVNPQDPLLGYLFVKFGSQYGIKGDVAFAQALLETNYFKFTGVVKPNQNNFGGIGATGPENSGASFSTPEEGVLANIQHLFA